MKFGFAVKALGATGKGANEAGQQALPSNDARRWQNNPHVRQSIEYMRVIFEYLDKVDIRMYRMSSDFVPYHTHPDLPQFHNQLDEAAEELADLGAMAKRLDIRLSLHPSQYILLNALEESIAQKSIADLNAQAALLDSLGCGPEAVVVTHVGGVYDDHESSLLRFIQRFPSLSEPARRRLVVENDDTSYSVSDVLRIHAETGCPAVFDNLHHFCWNPEGIPMRDALHQVLATWPSGVTPKIHYSSPSSAFQEVAQTVAGATGHAKKETRLRAPRLKAHADFIDPMAFAMFWELTGAASERNFDVMLESKAKDMALLRLREELKKQREFPGWD